MTRKPTFDQTVQKVRAYAAAPGATFQTCGVRIPAKGKPRIGIVPKSGVDMWLTQDQAEVWLSGYVTGKL